MLLHSIGYETDINKAMKVDVASHTHGEFDISMNDSCMQHLSLQLNASGKIADIYVSFR